jgi:hypothetical protein
MATKCASKSWADMQEDYEDEVASSRSLSPVAKPSYALIVSKGVDPCLDFECLEGSDSIDDSASDFSDFTVVSHKKKNMAKCESAILQWAKSKGRKEAGSRWPLVDAYLEGQINKCDDEIICNRCSSPFLFNAKSKEKYAEKGWKAPKICKTCSQMRFEERKI